MMQVDHVFGKELMHEANKCMSCWRLKHTKSLRECDLECVICQTGDHAAHECHGLYMPITFWQYFGHRPPHGYQILPKVDEQAYLVLAGILKYQKNKTWPIVPNMDHPLVREFYKGRDEPDPLFNKTKVPTKAVRKEESQAKLMTIPAAPADEMEAAPVLATALPTTDAAPIAFPLPNIAQPSIAPPFNAEKERNQDPRTLHGGMLKRSVAEKEVLPPTMEQQLHEVIAEKDARLAENDAKLAEMNAKLAEQDRELEEVKAIIGFKDEDHRRWMDEKDARIREFEAALELVRSTVDGVLVGDSANACNKRPRR